MKTSPVNKRKKYRNKSFPSNERLAVIRKQNFQTGFGLLELMLSMAILAILLSLAIPSFGSLLARNGVSSQSNELLQALYYARSSAISRQSVVHVCPLDPQIPNTCQTKFKSKASWSDGWLIYVDKNGNSNLDKNDVILRVFRLNNRFQIVFNQRGRLRFFPDGRARSAGFYLCDDNLSTLRHIYILYTGRVRVDKELSTSQKTICKQSA